MKTAAEMYEMGARAWKDIRLEAVHGDMIRGIRYASLEIDAILLDCETQCGLELDEIERIEAATEVEREQNSHKDS